MDDNISEISGKVYQFSNNSNGGYYFNNGITTKITLTDNGVIFSSEEDIFSVGSKGVLLIKKENVKSVRGGYYKQFYYKNVGVYRSSNENQDIFLYITQTETVLVIKRNGFPAVVINGRLYISDFNKKDNIITFEGYRIGDFSGLWFEYFKFYESDNKYILEGMNTELHSNRLFTNENEKIELVLSEAGQRNKNLSNQPISKRINEFNSDECYYRDSKFFLEVKDENYFDFYVDDNTMFENPYGLVGYVEGDDAIDWLYRLRLVYNDYTTDGIYDVSVTGNHIDIIHGFIMGE